MQFVLDPADIKAIATAIFEQMKAHIESQQQVTPATPPAAPVAAPVAVAPVVVVPAPQPAPVAAPVPVPAAARPIPCHADANGFAVDDIVPAGYPGTVTLAKTGHTLSLPEIAEGEGYQGYFRRVQLQAHDTGRVNGMGYLLQAGDAWWTPIGGFKTDGSNWPLGADLYFNPEAYNPGSTSGATGVWVSGEKPAQAQAAAPVSYVTDVPISS